MVILIFGLIISLSLLIYFYICNLHASIFPRLGFIDNEIHIDKIKFMKGGYIDESY